MTRGPAGRRLARVVLFAFSAQAAAAGLAAQDSLGNVFHDGAALDWGERSGEYWILPLYGDPSRTGEAFAFRIETQAGFEMAPHTHPVAEHMTVLSGTLHLGLGEVFDRTGARAYGPGSYITVGPGVAAFMWSEETTVVQVHGVGPFATEFVDGDGTQSGATDGFGPAVRALDSGTTTVLQAVSPVSEAVAWVGGHEGTILRTLDGGESWDRRPSPAADSPQFRDIQGFSELAAVVMSAGSGSASRIYLTEDGGVSWTVGFVMDHPDGFLDCLDFWDRERGFAYGDSFDGVPYVLVTRDGGRSWARTPREGLPPANEGEGGFAASGTCARAGEGGRGWIGTGAGGSARALVTDDYGVTWTAAEVAVARGPTAGIYSIVADEEATRDEGGWVMALGGDYEADEVLRNAAVSRDGGASWVAAGSAPIPGAIYGSALARSDESAVAVAVSPNGAAYTRDAGSAWIPLTEVRAWAVGFAPSGRVGWAVGAGGRVWRLDFKLR